MRGCRSVVLAADPGTAILVLVVFVLPGFVALRYTEPTYRTGAALLLRATASTCVSSGAATETSQSRRSRGSGAARACGSGCWDYPGVSTVHKTPVDVCGCAR